MTNLRTLTRLATMTAVCLTSAVLVAIGASSAADGTTSISAADVANIAGPLGVAAVGNTLYVSNPYFSPQGAGQFPVAQSVNVTDVATGSVTASYPIPSMLSSAFCQTNSCPADYYVEPYLAVSSGAGGFAAGEVFITQGPNIYEMAPGGGQISLFTTVPGLFTAVPLSDGFPEYASGITFDTVGSFGDDMIVTSTNGSVYQVTSTGTASLVGNVGTTIEGPAVAPPAFVEYAGDVLVGAEDANEVLAVSPAGVTSPVAPVAWAEGVQVVPSTLCGAAGPDGTDYTWFGSAFGNNLVNGIPTADFSGLSGDVIAQGEDSGMVTLISSPSSTSTTATTILSGLGQQEGATVDQCSTPTPCPPVHVRWHYSALGTSGSWSGTATCPTNATSLTMGPQSMEGALTVPPGTQLSAGYDFTLPGAHPATTVVFTNPQVSFVATCPNGAAGGAFTVTMPNATYTDPAGSSAWYPSGDQHSPLVYEGSISVPNLCNGGSVSLRQGGTFTTGIGGAPGSTQAG